VLVSAPSVAVLEFTQRVGVARRRQLTQRRRRSCSRLSSRGGCVSPCRRVSPGGGLFDRRVSTCRSVTFGCRSVAARCRVAARSVGGVATSGGRVPSGRSCVSSSGGRRVATSGGRLRSIRLSSPGACRLSVGVVDGVVVLLPT